MVNNKNLKYWQSLIKLDLKSIISILNQYIIETVQKTKLKYPW